MPKDIKPADDAQLIARAVRASGSFGVIIQDATVTELAGKRYVVLPRADCAPFVYRHYQNGELRPLVRFPPELSRGYDNTPEDTW
jgi:hypothetical protein